MMNANKVIMLIDTSMGPMSRNAPRNEMGIPSATQPASERLRNSVKTISTKARPISAFLSSRLIRSARISESSDQADTVTLAGSRARRRSA